MNVDGFFELNPNLLLTEGPERHWLLSNLELDWIAGSSRALLVLIVCRPLDNRHKGPRDWRQCNGWTIGSDQMDRLRLFGSGIDHQFQPFHLVRTANRSNPCPYSRFVKG